MVRFDKFWPIFHQLDVYKSKLLGYFSPTLSVFLIPLQSLSAEQIVLHEA